MATVKELEGQLSKMEVETNGSISSLAEKVDAILGRLDDDNDDLLGLGKDLEALQLRVDALSDGVPLSDVVPTRAAEEKAKRVLAMCAVPFPPEQIGKLPRKTCKECTNYQPCNRHQMVRNCPECGNNHTSATIHLDYVGHAEVTARLNAVDPLWNWEPMAVNPETGAPMMSAKGNDVTMWIRLTVGGVSRLGVGSVARDAFDVEKQLIGDALRNAAMRFGVGLDLWSKSENLDQNIEPDPPKADTYTATDPAPVEQEATTAATGPSGGVPDVPAADTAPPPPDPPRATTEDGPADLKTLERVMLDLPPRLSIKVKRAFEAEGDLWPMANISPGRVGDALTIVEELQALEG